MLYKCNSCDYYSNRKFNLQIHVQRKHANENLEIVASKSEIVAPESDEINTEVKQKVKKSLICTRCGKIFKSRQNKYRHMKYVQCTPATVYEEEVKLTDPPDSKDEIIILKDQIEKLKRRMRGFTETDKKKIAAGQDWKCNICKVSLPYDYHIDHIMPIHAGGLNETSNGQALCVECHKEKTFREKK